MNNVIIFSTLALLKIKIGVSQQHKLQHNTDDHETHQTSEMTDLILHSKNTSKEIRNCVLHKKKKTYFVLNEEALHWECFQLLFRK